MILKNIREENMEFITNGKSDKTKMKTSSESENRSNVGLNHNNPKMKTSSESENRSNVGLNHNTNDGLNHNNTNDTNDTNDYMKNETLITENNKPLTLNIEINSIAWLLFIIGFGFRFYKLDEPNSIV